jgi:hypothetical protein
MTQVQARDRAKRVSVAPAGNRRRADGSNRQNIVDPDPQLAQAPAGGVIDRIGELGQPFGAAGLTS